jgi:hypothetical protein
VAQAHIEGDNDISGQYEAGVRKGFELARLAIIEILNLND